MTLLKNEIDMRALPSLYTHTDGTPVTPETWEARRAELRKILSEHEYGYAPGGAITNQLDDPSVVTVRETRKKDTNMCAGKVTGEWFDVCFPTPMGEFSFPVCLFRPNHPVGIPSGRPLNRDKVPLVIHINFRPLVPDKYFPLEEITDAGFAAAQIYYEDVTSDNGDYTNGLAGHYPEYGTEEGNRTPTAWGKLRMWAYAASRLMDVLQRRDDIDTDRIFVAGHSRLGKTALVTAAFDDRFAGACSNDSGCSGAAITRDKVGELVNDYDNLRHTLFFGVVPCDFIVASDVADTYLFYERKASFHLGYRPRESACRLLGLVHNGNEKVGDTLIHTELNLLRVNHNELDLVGVCLIDNDCDK